MSHFLGAHHLQLLFDRSVPPVLTVDPGEAVTFEVLDACYGEVRKIEDLPVHRAKGRPRGNPLTGPVAVRGAHPGGALVVEIVSVELAEQGFQLIGPNRAIIRDEVDHWEHHAVRIRNNRIVLDSGIELPVDPVIGTLGNAPAGEPTNAPFRLGGNLDVPAIRTGARVHLPVEVEGALFCLGDIHARQGDGEVVGAPEIGGKVTVRFQVEPVFTAPWPMVEDEHHWHLITCGATEAEAMRIGVLEMARFMDRRFGVRFEDALILLTMTVQLNGSRTGQWAGLEPVITTSFDKRMIADAIATYRRPG